MSRHGQNRKKYLESMFDIIKNILRFIIEISNL